MKYLRLFIPLLFLFSCYSELDFDQAESIEIQPVVELDMLYFDIHKPNLIDNQGNFRNVIQDTVDFGIFEDGKVRDGFLKAEITVGYSNTFLRNFYTEYFFIDENEQAVDEGNFNIPPADSQQPEISGEYTFIFDKQNNPEFVNFRKIVIRVTVAPDTFPVEEKELHVQTKGTFYINTTIE